MRYLVSLVAASGYLGHAPVVVETMTAEAAAVAYAAERELHDGSTIYCTPLPSGDVETFGIHVNRQQIVRPMVRGMGE